MAQEIAVLSGETCCQPGWRRVRYQGRPIGARQPYQSREPVGDGHRIEPWERLGLAGDLADVALYAAETAGTGWRDRGCPKPDGNGSTYHLTPAGRELWVVLQAIGEWGVRWLELAPATASPDVVLWSWATAYLQRDRLPAGACWCGSISPTSPHHDGGYGCWCSTAGRRVWNGAIDRGPAYVARCAGVGDVVAALRFARERDLLVAVRSGGHGVAGTAVCDDGLVIDLSPMKDVQPRRGTARVDAGVLWGELDASTQAFCLATTGGVVSHTGIAGLTLGGSIGWLMRRYGLTIDNLLAAEVVTAAGDVVTTSAHDHPDLFWGLRGGGGNFGIVTSFTYRLHPVGPGLLAGPVLWPLEDAPEVLRSYRQLVAEAPQGGRHGRHPSQGAAGPLASHRASRTSGVHDHHVLHRRSHCG